jgi:hypothetical protein
MSDYSHFYNEAGEPMQDGPSMRYEMQLDAESAYERAYDDYFEGYWADYEPDEPDEIFTCNWCGDEFDSDTRMNAHYDTDHNNEEN